MKTIILWATMAVIAVGQSAPMEFETLETTKGRIYEHAKVKKIEADGISISHDSGTAKIQFDSLSKDLQTAFGYDPEKAAEYRKTKALEEIGKQAAQSALLKQKPSAAAEDGKRSKKPEPDQQIEIEKPILVSVALTAKTGSAKRDETTSWQTSWGSYNKDIDQSRSISVSLRNGTDQAGTAYVEVLWLTTGADRKSGVLAVSNIVRKKMILNARETVSGTVSQSFTRSDDNYRALGVREMSGRGFGGWVIRVVDPASKRVIAVSAMREPLKKWSEDVEVGNKSDFK